LYISITIIVQDGQDGSQHRNLLQAGQSRDQTLVEARISMPSKPAVRYTQPPEQWVLGLSWGVRQLEPGTDHLPPPGTKVKNG